MTAVEPTLQPGARIERFEVVQVLGSGGTAHVYRVRHTMLGSDHALKLLTPAHAALRDRLAQEGRVQARLRHPNIVAVTDVVEHEGRPGLVMELVRGPTLDHWLRDRGPMAPLDAIRLMDGVLAAVAAAHAAEVLHRDLKPANVLLEDGPQGLIARVTDFGIAKVFSDDARVGHTRIGITMGTPGYMAPEQWADAANADASSDVFALGVILYELIAGSRPYDGESSTAVLDATVAGRHVRLVDRVPSIDPEVAAAIERAIRPDPAERFPSVAAFRDALREAAGIATRAEPTIALPSLGGDSPNPTFVPTRTHMPVVAALVAPILFGSLTLGAMFWWASRATVAVPHAPMETHPLVFDTGGPLLVAGGPFFIGSPPRAVEVGSFRIDRTEVANADYLECVATGECTPPEWKQASGHEEYDGLLGDRQPVVGVTWTQASAYCAWRNGRLPTEVEWERAATWSPYAMSATDKRPWPWGAAAPSCELANYQACRTGTREVTDLSKGASAYGVLNMVGNVWEWTSTDHYLGFNKKKGIGSVFQKKPALRIDRVLKGGAYDTSASDISPTSRFHASEDAASALYGFRCAYDAP
jgi:formylglycine-generating enzyme required for sulfatase activity